MDLSVLLGNEVWRAHFCCGVIDSRLKTFFTKRSTWLLHNTSYKQYWYTSLARQARLRYYRTFLFPVRICNLAQLPLPNRKTGPTHKSPTIRDRWLSDYQINHEELWWYGIHMIRVHFATTWLPITKKVKTPLQKALQFRHKTLQHRHCFW